MFKELEKLLTRAQNISNNFSQSTIESHEFKQTLFEFQKLEEHPDPILKKIGRLAVIFKDAWTERQWLNLLVPLERYLNRRLSDSEILGSQEDLSLNELITSTKLPLSVIVDHWRSAFNVGSLFRLADGFGISKIYLTGYTPTPEHPAVQKTSMGTVELTPWEHWESTGDLIDTLKSQSLPVWALESCKNSPILGEVILPTPMAILLGNERFGLDPQILNSVDETVQILLRGRKNSMNAANCFGMFAYEWCRQHAK